jgi:hypothetical protein
LDTVGKTRLQAFEELFTKWAWAETADANLEHGLQKIALYALFGEPTHAARLMPNGFWTSKLGGAIDITHNNLAELTGPKYGMVYKVYKK